MPRPQPPWASTTDEVSFAASASEAAVTVIACADDNVVRLTPAAKIVAMNVLRARFAAAGPLLARMSRRRTATTGRVTHDAFLPGSLATMSTPIPTELLFAHCPKPRKGCFADVALHTMPPGHALIMRKYLISFIFFCGNII